MTRQPGAPLGLWQAEREESACSAADVVPSETAGEIVTRFLFISFIGTTGAKSRATTIISPVTKAVRLRLDLIYA